MHIVIVFLVIMVFFMMRCIVTITISGIITTDLMSQSTSTTTASWNHGHGTSTSIIMVIIS